MPGSDLTTRILFGMGAGVLLGVLLNWIGFEAGGFLDVYVVDGLPSMPVFTRDDTLGSGSTESIQGRTRYTAESVSRDGNEVRGSYVRDGSKNGTFTMRRVGAVVVIGSKQDRREQKKKKEDR